MIRDVTVALFAIAAGFTVSGVVANFYRLVVGGAARLEGPGNIAVMVVAGPNVLFEKAAVSLRTKSCSSLAFWLAAAVSAYWSFVLGLFLLNLAVVL